MNSIGTNIFKLWNHYSVLSYMRLYTVYYKYTLDIGPVHKQLS